MTKEQFDNTGFKKGMKFKYPGDIVAEMSGVNFEDRKLYFYFWQEQFYSEVELIEDKDKT